MAEITYIKNGDYFIPNLKFKETEHKPLGKYGRMRKHYLKNYNQILWNHLILSENLFDHLYEIDIAAQSYFDALLPIYTKREGITEELKSTDQTEWIRRMNNVVHSIEEIIFNEIVYR